MDIRKDTLGNVRVLRPSGRLDLLTATQLKQRFTEEISAGHSKLVVDLASVSFIDSTGLGALIGGLRATRAAGGDLRIAGANKQARTILELTTLDRILRPYDSAEQAASGF